MPLPVEVMDTAWRAGRIAAAKALQVTLSLIKEARIRSGEKTASSISGAGKTGQLHVKE